MCGFPLGHAPARVALSRYHQIASVVGVEENEWVEIIHGDVCPSNMEQAKVWLDKDVDLEDALVVCCFLSVGMVSSVVAHFF